MQAMRPSFSRAVCASGRGRVFVRAMRITVEPRHAYRLINHGPTVLVSAQHGERRNVMAAAWIMPVDFDPPKIGIVLATGTLTRELVDASREFVINIPPRTMVDVAYALGKVTGHDADKFDRYALETSPATRVGAPLVEGCVGWLECRAIDEPAIEERYDLFVAEVVAAWADDRAFAGGEWRFERDGDRTLHHLARGVFLTIGERVEARRIDPPTR
jgi:flavin reductase (DIM6/NTAB) family NADH-FMN oxidoreductase RutF